MTLEITDKELVAQALKGDQQAKAQIVLLHQELVYNLALKLTGNADEAENVLQETFLSVFENLDRFRGDAALKTWIYRIAANEALMAIRRRKGDFSFRSESIDLSEASRYARMLRSLDRNPLELLMDAEFKNALETAMSNLPDSWRIPFVLKDIEGLSLQEIADSLKTTVPAVKAALHRGRNALRDHLADFIEQHQDSPEKKETSS
ncbi:MAG: sigma-70 family RNA polymerase sigma factor [bacterium]|nr:sigma-70 family RNA polymerase sigma factor [bacterium]